MPIDVVVLDLGAAGSLGRGGRQPRAAAWGPQVLVVSADGERRKVVDAIGAGAGGYLTKTAEPSEITEATRIVGRRWHLRLADPGVVPDRLVT